MLLHRHCPRLRQAGKVLLSGVLFTLLGLGGLGLSLLVVPVLGLLPGGRAGLGRRARWLIHHCFRLFLWALEAGGILRVEARGMPGPEALRGTLLLCNHPSYLDVVVLVGLMPTALCVVKQAVYRSFWFGGLVRAAGYLPIGSAPLLQAGLDALHGGQTLILFPEGTRSTPGRPIRCLRGAAHLALAGARVLPLVLDCSPALLAKGHRWYHVPIETCRFQVRAGGATPFDPLAVAGTTPPLAARRLTEALESYYNKEAYVTDQGRDPA